MLKKIKIKLLSVGPYVRGKYTLMLKKVTAKFLAAVPFISIGIEKLLSVSPFVLIGVGFWLIKPAYGFISAGLLIFIDLHISKNRDA